MRRARMPGSELGCSEMDRRTSVISAWGLSRIASGDVWLRPPFRFLAGRMSPLAFLAFLALRRQSRQHPLDSASSSSDLLDKLRAIARLLGPKTRSPRRQT